LFSRQKEEIVIMQNSLKVLENSQKNTELMIDSINKIIEKDKDKGKDIIYNEEDKLKSAYALNLCTVSVSQIIDYNDENILEQEYETILNNLNLEHMPKDEALLNILKQLLDTVTFFRIQEGDKELIEKEYQHKVKNAIWSAIPNFGLIVAGGNPYTMAVSLASQVGIGYMNYRRVKAENKLEKEQNEWQLQRAAIEQLNGLRRELFDASWRLADRYEFPDEYRLTERQISQYNKILMDTDDIRRYERLEAIEKYFIAYPPFWYYFGNAANKIAGNALSDGNNDIYLKYKRLAIEHFEKYMESNKYALLRDDQITSSCALEYIELLDATNDRSKIMELLDCAIKMSGSECDILQICAMDYLRINDITPAINLLKYMINENYNTVTNAQLLSSIYVSGYIERKDVDHLVGYKMLQKKVNNEFLFPFPSDNLESIEELKSSFISKQQDLLYRKYAYVIENHYKKYAIKFNKSIPAPNEDRIYPETYYSDQYDFRIERLKQYKKLFSNRNKAYDYAYRLRNSNYALEYLDILNEVVNSIEEIIPEEKINVIPRLIETIEDKIVEKKHIIFNPPQNNDESFEIERFEIFFNLSLDFFTRDFYEQLDREIMDHVKGIQNMVDFSIEETKLREFCIKQGITEINDFTNIQPQSIDEYSVKKEFFTFDLLDEETQKRANINKIAIRIANHIDNATDKILRDKKKMNTHIYTRWNNDSKGCFNEYFNKGKKKNNKTYKKVDPKIVAILKNDSIGIDKMDLIFTTDGIFVQRLLNRPRITYYKDIECENNTLKIANEKYRNKEVDIKNLFDLIQELSELSHTTV